MDTNPFLRGEHFPDVFFFVCEKNTQQPCRNTSLHFLGFLHLASSTSPQLGWLGFAWWLLGLIFCIHNNKNNKTWGLGVRNEHNTSNTFAGKMVGNNHYNHSDNKKGKNTV